MKKIWAAGGTSVIGRNKKGERFAIASKALSHRGLRSFVSVGFFPESVLATMSANTAITRLHNQILQVYFYRFILDTRWI